MKSVNFKELTTILLLSAILLFSGISVAMASNHSVPPPPPNNGSTPANPNPGGGNYGVSGGQGSIVLDDPLSGSGITSIEGLVKTLLNVLIVLAAPIVVIFIIIAGFKYVTAQGDPGKLEEAKRALVYAIIGGVIIVGAVAIFEIIVNTINAFSD